MVTLITAFGIAIVKAYLVAKNFMHLNIEQQYVVYLIMTMLVFMLLFFAGTSPDVMKCEGDNWEKPKVEQALVARRAPLAEEATPRGALHRRTPRHHRSPAAAR